MRTRLLLATVCILALPMFFSYSKEGMRSTPFVTVAFAGHTIYGNWCECGTLDCICDPGERTGGNSTRPISDASVEPGPRPKAGRVSELDFGTGALLIALALFLWARLRS
ncbi:MAG TPA: hypothetical protein VN937_22605 [Blastocatellia bacterium]|nr:hypothetical protein [Blastocatellia bacterium]